jgi:hypothetical protein
MMKTIIQADIRYIYRFECEACSSNLNDKSRLRNIAEHLI